MVDLKIRVSSVSTTCLICMVFVVENERRQIFAFLGCPMVLICHRGRRFGRMRCARVDAFWGPWGARPHSTATGVVVFDACVFYVKIRMFSAKMRFTRYLRRVVRLAGVLCAICVGL